MEHEMTTAESEQEQAELLHRQEFDKAPALHTPTPWRYEAATTQEGDWDIVGANNLGVAEILYYRAGRIQENAANAAFIVTACNAHDDLLAAAEGCLVMHAGMTPQNIEARWETLRISVAKARGS